MSSILNLINSGLLSLGISPSYVLGLSIFIAIMAIGVVSWLANYIAKHYLVKLMGIVANKLDSNWGQYLDQFRVFQRLSHLAPALIIYYSVPIFNLQGTDAIANFLRMVSVIYMILITAFTLSAFLSSFATVYRYLRVSQNHPVKSYVQVAKIIIFAISSILVFSIILNKSPTALLTGLGALTAVLMLVFKDSILGFVASIQNASYDMVRVGDWIEMPKYGADGDVIDMSLNTIKIQNFDKTIVSIPTHALMNEGIKNWRGMSESGGRRIKRSIYIDINSIQFCPDDLLKKIEQIQYMDEYIQQKQQEILSHNTNLGIDRTLPCNGRQLTNVGCFRAYCEQYLRRHPNIHTGMTFLIRQLQPTEKGLPLELYLFTNDTQWANYEAIQADIFDHLLAIIPEFELKVFQNISNQNISVQLTQDALSAISGEPANNPIKYPN